LLRAAVPVLKQDPTIQYQTLPNDVYKRPLRITLEKMSPNLQHSDGEISRITEVDEIV
jgi:hypothetical protein